VNDKENNSGGGEGNGKRPAAGQDHVRAIGMAAYIKPAQTAPLAEYIRPIFT